jgi:hypothetical protein
MSRRLVPPGEVVFDAVARMVADPGLWDATPSELGHKPRRWGPAGQWRTQEPDKILKTARPISCGTRPLLIER